MADYNTRLRSAAASQDYAIDEGLRAYMLRVYNYMLLGLALTGGVAWFTANTPAFLQLFFQQAGRGYSLSPLGWVALFAPLGIVFFLRFRLQAMSLAAVQATFWVYAGLMGLSLTPILLVYTGSSVARVFFISAATFGAMSLYGYTTKSDLFGVGNFLRMGVFGILIAMLVNIFMQSSGLDWAISIIGVGIFVGLTATDTQAIKESYSANYDGTVSGKMAVMGALQLYLDFVNMFLFLLRLLGDRR
jgi:uncharacterized protein